MSEDKLGKTYPPRYRREDDVEVGKIDLEGDLPLEAADINNDGKIDKGEIVSVQNRFKNRRRMAWVSLYAMLVVSAILMSPVVTDTRVEALSGVLDMFYFAMASVIGSYMGFTTWATLHRK